MGLYYYIGVNRFDESLLKKDDYFKNNVDEVGDVSFSNIGMRDRIIVFSQMTPIPPFAIDSVSNKCKEEYDDPDQGICFHFSVELLDEMRRKGYSLEPGGNDNALELWVKGLLFGLIKNENGTYMYKDEENGDSLRGYWVTLDSYRDIAYAKFKECKGAVEDQFKRKIYQTIMQNGQPFIENLYRKAKEDYLTNFSQLGLTREYLLEHERELQGIADLIRQEQKFVKDQLEVIR